MTTLTQEFTTLDDAIKLYEPEFSKFLQSLTPKFQELQTRLLQANAGGDKQLEYYKWLDFDYLTKINQETKLIASQIKKQNYKHALVMGMGGSGINSLVLKNALQEFVINKPSDSIQDWVVQNNLDPTSMLGRISKIDLNKTLFIIISKSGSTDEVKRNITTLLDFWSKQSKTDIAKKFAEQSVYITEPPREGKKNFLHTMRAELKSKTGFEPPYLENDPNIGGRFSLFSPVGMFSAELMGLDSEALINGAKQVFAKFEQVKSIQESVIAKLAALDIFLARKDFQSRYSMVYSDSLEALNKFRAQLKGESLNKNGIDSTVHVPGIGTVNHHSDLELLLKTNNKLILEQIFFNKPAEDHSNQKSLDCLSDLVGQSNHKSLIDNHINPLYNYLLENKAPVIQTRIPEQNETNIAAFCMQDMLVTIVQAGLQDSLGSIEKLDLAVRQWEVEKYKSSLKK